MKELYGPFTRTGAPILTMSTESASCVQVRGELDSRHAHSFHERDCERVRAGRRRRDHVRKAIGSDRRIGTSFCFRRRLRRQLLSEDTQALLKSAQDKGTTSDLRAVEDVNDAQKSGSSTRSSVTFRTCRGGRSRCGACVQAAHRRHARGAGDSDHRGGCWRGANREGVERPAPRRWRAASSAIGSRSATGATMRSRAPTRWRS